MASVSLLGQFKSTATEVWESVSDFGGIGKYMDAVSECSCEGTGVGAVRTLTLPDGGVVVEKLVSLDEGTKTLSYAIISSPLPVANYVATMKLSDSDKGGCQLQWSSTFEADGVPEEAAKQIVEGIYEGGIAGFQKHHGE